MGGNTSGNAGNNMGGNNGTNPGSGEHPYNENVAPHVRLAARPSKVRTINSSSSNGNYSTTKSNSNDFKVRKSVNLDEPITQERLRRDMELSKKIRQELSGNN